MFPGREQTPTFPGSGSDLRSIGDRIGMRLAWKLIVALLLGLIAVLALSGWLRVREEIKVFENDMRRDHEVVSHMLLEAILADLRHGGLVASRR